MARLHRRWLHFRPLGIFCLMPPLPVLICDAYTVSVDVLPALLMSSSVWATSESASPLQLEKWKRKEKQPLPPQYYCISPIPVFLLLQAQPHPPPPVTPRPTLGIGGHIRLIVPQTSLMYDECRRCASAGILVSPKEYDAKNQETSCISKDGCSYSLFLCERLCWVFMALLRSLPWFSPLFVSHHVARSCCSLPSGLCDGDLGPGWEQFPPALRARDALHLCQTTGNLSIVRAPSAEPIGQIELTLFYELAALILVLSQMVVVPAQLVIFPVVSTPRFLRPAA
jgi:hypothetical protein